MGRKRAKERKEKKKKERMKEERENFVSLEERSLLFLLLRFGVT